MQDLKSQLALMLRRKMLMTLSDKDFADASHGEEMLAKYGDTLIPREEIEWFGLSIKDALYKHKIEDAKANEKPPLKYQLAKQMLEDLKNNPPGEDSLHDPADKRRYVVHHLVDNCNLFSLSLVCSNESSLPS